MKGNNGSELHRLTELKPYDEDLFNRLYKTCKPLIRRLTRGVDSRRFNLTPDIINSFSGISSCMYLINTKTNMMKRG